MSSAGHGASESGTLKRKTSVHIKDTTIAGLYNLGKTIGQGHFAIVKQAKHVFTDEEVAVKIIDKTKIDAMSQENIMKEVRCMKLVQHPNIVRLFEVLDTQTKMFLILELGDYDLHDFIIKHENGVSEKMGQNYFSQIIKAIDYCHQLHVVHRDLKPENVVFFERLGMVKLTDFGFSNCYEPGQQLSTSCGSLAYSAPEILLGDSYDAPAVDVWSLGVILYMLLCGRLPFQEANDSETLTKILDCHYSIPDTMSQICRCLVESMLVREPTKRAKLMDIVNNSWIVAGDRGYAKEIPLIVRHHLPPSAHETIVEQMVAGGVANVDKIITDLENNEYNSVTATYYLLAERVLSVYREEQAKVLEAKDVLPQSEEEKNDQSRTPRPVVVAGPRCRSRSNSWRARPCSILKEESEEELSTYLRSASRQSSRFFLPSASNDDVGGGGGGISRCGSYLSRQNSETSELEAADSDCSGGGGAAGGRPTTLSSSSLASNYVLSPRFEDVLSPIDECHSTEHVDFPLPAKIRRNWSLPRLACDMETALQQVPGLVRRSSSRQLVRRNSSPSVSMFEQSARDRISPQAVQDLLSLSRIKGTRRSDSPPESCRGSRTPSPTSASGRTSPAQFTLSSFSRLKVSQATGGMRKLSSSPHLLGICEEGEEGQETTCHVGISGHHLTTPTEGVARTNRSASTGLVQPFSIRSINHNAVCATRSSSGSLAPTSALKPPPVPKVSPAMSSGSTSSLPAATSTTSVGVTTKLSPPEQHSVSVNYPTYSSVRCIRPRQAIVSPDVCRRYEQHQRFIARSRRSTSCSSSEASDDEEGRRLTMISKSCHVKKPTDKGDDDKDDGDVGGAARRVVSQSGVDKQMKGASGEGTSSGVISEKRSTGGMNDCLPTQQLRPIPEMTSLDLSDNLNVFKKTKLLRRSLTAERILRDWSKNTVLEEDEVSASIDCNGGTPPRDAAVKTEEESSSKEKWIRRLQRANSQPVIAAHRRIDEIVEEEEHDDIQSSESQWQEDCDSGFSIEDSREAETLTTNIYAQLDYTPCHALPIEKVGRWLRTTTQFVQ